MEGKIEVIGKMVEKEMRDKYVTSKAGDLVASQFHEARISGMMDIVELLYGKEQRAHMVKLAASNVKQLQINGAI